MGKERRGGLRVELLNVTREQVYIAFGLKYRPVPLRRVQLGSSTGVIIAPYHEKRVLALGGLEIAASGRKSGSNSGHSLPQTVPRP